MDLTQEQEELLKQVAQENDAKSAAQRRKDRTRQMDDVVRAMRRRGFKGDEKVRWMLPDADMLLMQGLAYAIGPDVEWLPEYEEVARWLSDNQGKGLLCIGNCGRGKTVITRDVLPLLFKPLGGDRTLQDRVRGRYRNGEPAGVRATVELVCQTRRSV